MKKTTLAALIGATALVLSACGGGGGSSSPSTSANNTVPNNNNNANNNGNAHNNNGGNANIGKNTATDFKSVQASQLDKLTVGGVTSVPEPGSATATATAIMPSAAPHTAAYVLVLPENQSIIGHLLSTVSKPLICPPTASSNTAACI